MTEARRLLERIRPGLIIGGAINCEYILRLIDAYLAQPMTTCEDVAAR